MKQLVIDGGPCSGKTTGMTRLSRKLFEMGKFPIIVPEAARFLIGSGVSPGNMGNGTFQHRLAKLQLSHEEYFREVALEAEKIHKREAILLCDRGILTGAAYLGNKTDLADFQERILEPLDLNVEKVRSRYEGVIHLVTAANGAPEFYNQDDERSENLEGAIIRDDRTQQVWLGHAHVAVIHNRVGGKQITMDDKMDRLRAETCRLLGIPVPVEVEDKYILDFFDPKVLPVPHEGIHIEQTYLVPDGEGEERVRMRTWMGYRSYTHTIKVNDPASGGRKEFEHPISRDRYDELLSRRDPDRFTIRKTRYCFIWEAQYFEADVLHGELEGSFYLERERTDQNKDWALPDFLAISSNVTRNPLYSMANLALLKR